MERPSSWPLLLPAAYLVHLGEESWAGEGLVRWTGEALGRSITPGRFLVLNAVVWPLFTLLTIAALKKPALAWFPTTFATLVVVNAGLHGLGSLVTASYSPGLVTGLCLYLPIGGRILVESSRRLPPERFGLAVLGGVLVHAVVAAVAFA